MTIAAGLTPAAQIAAQPGRYPPALTGLRGQHAGSFDAAHALAREGRRFPVDGAPIGETYDLVVVGGGISGLAAAWFYRRAKPSARILILDNHDDFGGHAKRNEFMLDGRRIIGYGGSQSLQSPNTLYSPVAKGLLRDLGVDITRFEKAFESDLYPSPGLDRPLPWDCNDPSWKDHPCFTPDEKFQVTPESMVDPKPGPDLGNAKVFDANAYVRDGYLIVNFPDETLVWFPGYKALVVAYPLLMQKGIELLVALLNRGLALRDLLVGALEIAFLLLDELDAAIEGGFLLLERPLGGELRVAGRLVLPLELLAELEGLLLAFQHGGALERLRLAARLLHHHLGLPLSVPEPGRGEPRAQQPADPERNDGTEN
ncbi:MAG: FAD/NAD(P)-binding protein, partial [Hyphomicrobiales bacterium]